MNRKPDVIRVLVIVFALGLVVTGISSLQATEGHRADELSAKVLNNNLFQKSSRQDASGMVSAR